ncbi:Putative acetyltransferase [Fulvivirga imtechensis AK7]|uniref:Putative acetyltransferase n=1 Tax=Fulvivirga imtechensis AK7 TaxID=1237149 RepID=L8JQ44_9BACT|nr:GNAT family N-acetyltransferase [Fulvivirga imtechensis]ELR69502.1 Putative acetyltransferase [Fulvivirga imtechensis AK7]
MVHLEKCDSHNVDFIKLVGLLDKDLAERDGDEHAFYAQFNKIDKLRYVVLAYDGDRAVGCGAIKPLDNTAMEVKRMYVLPEQRGKKIASAILGELEAWAAELGYNKCVLETGKKQPEAIALYLRNRYREIPNYGQYEGVENSVCFEKLISE